MYTPKPFAEADFARLQAVVEANSFGLLIGNGPEAPLATHLPFLIDLDTETGAGRLLCHMARPNPHWRAIEADGAVLAVFTGPHAYVSPRWYATPVAVPTWNYLAVHVHGRARTLHEPAELRPMLERLTALHEAGHPRPWTLEEAPAEFVEGMLGGIVGVEIAIERIEGKRKLSQNRSAADQAGVIAELAAEGSESGRLVAAEMAPTDFDQFRSND